SIIGYAGSGKSTILKRLGMMLSQNGHTAFLSYSDYLPRINEFITVLKSIDKQVVLLFDNSNNILTQLPNLIDAFIKELENLPIVCLSIRTNFSNRLSQYVPSSTCIQNQYKIPDLDDAEIHNIISKLDEHN